MIYDERRMLARQGLLASMHVVLGELLLCKHNALSS